jgi:hypothetical protein
VAVTGGQAKSVTLVHGRLVIVLRGGSRRLAVRLGPAAVRESSHLRSRATHHRLKSLAVMVGVTNTAGQVAHLRLMIHKLGLPAGQR